MKKFNFIVLFLLLQACNFGGGKELKVAENQPPHYPTVKALEFMAAKVKELSGGKLSMKVFHSGQLGQEKDAIELVKAGTIAMTRINSAALNNIAPETLVLTLPYIFRSKEHMYKVLDGEIGQQILESLSSAGLLGLAYYDNGVRSVYNSKKPILSLADFKGLKIRVQSSDLIIDFMNALGASATPMNFGEVYASLKTNVIDGAENNWPSYFSTGHYEVAKYYSITEHSRNPEMLLISKKIWNSLSAEEKTWLQAAAKESVGFMRSEWAKFSLEAKNNLVAKGVIINNIEDLTSFREAVSPVYEKYLTTELLKNLVQKIQEQ